MLLCSKMCKPGGGAPAWLQRSKVSTPRAVHDLGPPPCLSLVMCLKLPSLSVVVSA